MKLCLLFILSLLCWTVSMSISVVRRVLYVKGSILSGNYHTDTACNVETGVKECELQSP